MQLSCACIASDGGSWWLLTGVDGLRLSSACDTPYHSHGTAAAADLDYKRVPMLLS